MTPNHSINRTALRCAPVCRLCQTLGVTRNMSVNLTHHVITPRPARQAIRCVSASAELHVRAMPTLRPRSEERPFVAFAKVVGHFPNRTTRASRNHRAEAFQAQLVPALARRRRQMLVSLWALPLSAGRCGLRSTEKRGSGVGSIRAALRFSTSLTPNPSIKRTVKGLRPSPAAYVKR